jgi:hypothetical protein
LANSTGVDYYVVEYQGQAKDDQRQEGGH